jgi:hypothetical protein
VAARPGRKGTMSPRPSINSSRLGLWSVAENVECCDDSSRAASRRSFRNFVKLSGHGSLYHHVRLGMATASGSRSPKVQRRGASMIRPLFFAAPSRSVSARAEHPRRSGWAKVYFRRRAGRPPAAQSGQGALAESRCRLSHAPALRPRGRLPGSVADRLACGAARAGSTAGGGPRGTSA